MDYKSITWRMSLEASVYCTLSVTWKAAHLTLYKGRHLMIRSTQAKQFRNRAVVDEFRLFVLFGHRAHPLLFESLVVKCINMLLLWFMPVNNIYKRMQVAHARRCLPRTTIVGMSTFFYPVLLTIA